MNNEIEIPLLISFVVLIALIAFVVWKFGIRKQPSDKKMPFSSPGYRDKLTLIDGIGATLEARLNSLGITSFRQIAEFNDQDIERVNEVLNFKGRIEREGWVAQAKKLVEAASRPDGAGKPQADAGGKKKTPVDKTTRKKVIKKKTGAKKSAGKSAKKSAKKANRKTKGGGR